MVSGVPEIDAQQLQIVFLDFLNMHVRYQLPTKTRSNMVQGQLVHPLLTG